MNNKELELKATGIVHDFTNELKKHSVKVKKIPKVKAYMSPNIICYWDKTNTIYISFWEELQSEFQRFLNEHTDGKGKEVFELSFHWFWIPHEVIHHICDEYNLKLDHYSEEKIADDFACAYWYQKDKTKLLKFKKYLEKLSGNIENPVPKNVSEKEYFNKNYERISKEPFMYGYFQFKFVLNSMESVTLNSLKELCKKTFESNIIDKVLPCMT